MTSHTLMREDRGYINPREYGSALDHTTLQAALTAIGSAQQSLLLTPGTWTIGAPLTIPANVTLVRSRGAILSVSSTFTVTLNGDQEGPLAPWITGAGTVVFGGGVAEVYPQWWGAVGDGATVNTTAIQQAINALNAAGGGRLIFPPGTYLTGSLTLRSGVILQGTARAVTVLKLANTVNNHLIKTAQGASNVGLERLTLDGNRANNTGTWMNLYVFDAAGYSVRDVRSINAAGDGLYIGGGSGTTGPSTDGRIDQYSAVNIGRNGVSIISAKRLTATGVTIESCDLIGIDLEPNPGSASDVVDEISFVNPTVVQADDVGMNINIAGGIAIPVSITFINPTVLSVSGGGNQIGFGIQSAPIEIVGGTIAGCASHGIDISSNGIIGGTRGAVISDVTIRNNGGAGIRATNNSVKVEGLVIRDNYIHSNGSFGINAFGLQHSIIRGNKIRHNTGRGIRLADAGAIFSLDNLLTDNLVYDDEAVPTQTVGIETIQNSTTNAVYGNYLGVGMTTKIALAGTNILRQNLGFATEAWGNAVIPSAGTSVTVTHGLGYQPTSAEISVILTQNPTAAITAVWISGITATVFVINCEPAPGADLGVSWAVRKV